LLEKRVLREARVPRDERQEMITNDEKEGVEWYQVESEGCWKGERRKMKKRMKRCFMKSTALESKGDDGKLEEGEIGCCSRKRLVRGGVGLFL
jgi:hypothetical protein